MKTIRIDDCENTTFEGKNPGSGFEERGQAVRQEQNLDAELLQQMTLLCQTVPNLGKQIQEGFAADRAKRQQDLEVECRERRDDYNNMERTMTAKKDSRTSYKHAIGPKKKIMKGALE